MAKAAQFADDPLSMGKPPDMAPSKAHLNVSEELRSSTMSLNKRSMVMDEDRFEDQFLRCGICKRRFGQGCLPRLLPCHHSYCHPCVLQLYQAAKEQRQNLQSTLRSITTSTISTVSVNCPTCRSNFIATDDNINKLPTDHRVVQLMDFINHTERHTISYCSKHNLQPLNFFCEPCVRPVCRDCTVLNHKEVDGHLVMDLEEAMSKYTPVIETALAEMDAEAITLEEKRLALDNVVQTIDTVKTELLADTKSCMSRLRLIINEREKALEAKIHQEIEKEKTKLNEKGELLRARSQVLETQIGRLKQAKDENNVEDIFRSHQEIQECMSVPPLKIREVDDGIMTSFALSTRDEALLASRINNFADIASKVETTASRTKSTLRNYYRNNSSTT